MATYVNDLRLKEIATGDESGTWGTSTNTNLELVAEAFSYGTEASFGSDADATTTIADGVSDPARSLYFKVTSGVSLTATRTLTLAPNTVSKIWIIENATSGSQSINISQGSGSNVTIGNGDVKIVYSDGGGASANVVDAFTDLSVTDKLKIEGSTPTLTIGDGGEEDTKLVFDGNAKDFYVGLDDSADKLVIGEGSTVGTNSIVTLTDDSVTIGDGAEVDTKIVFDGNAQDFYVGLDDSADDLVIGLGSTVGTTPAMSVDENQLATFHAGVTLTGTTPTLTIGDAGEEDTKLVFDGNAQDFYIGLDDSADDLIIGSGSTVGTTPAITIDENQDVTITQDLTVSTNFTSRGIDDNASSTAITIDSSSNVGVGTSSPAVPLHAYNTGAEIARFEGNDEFAYLGLRGTVSSVATSLGYFGFANDTGTAADLNITNAQNGDISFKANSAERARILSSGGLTFNGDTAAANALDDYEEGTWTPTYVSNYGLATVSGITSASGYYVKVGKLVHQQAIFTMNGNSSTAIQNGDNILIAGEPFEAQTSWIHSPGVSYTTNAFSNLGGAWGPAYHYSSYYVCQFVATSGISQIWAGDEANTVFIAQTLTIA